MLGKMRFEIAGHTLHTQTGSRLHGFIMDQLDQETAGLFHESGLKPFSQSVYVDQGEVVWEINTLNQYTWNLFQKKLGDIEVIQLHNGLEYTINKKEYFSIEKGEFIKKYLALQKPNAYVNLQFLTPTAFKSYGDYIHYPDVRLILQSLLKKFDAFQEDYNYFSEALLEDMQSMVRLDNYKVWSNKYALEGVKIPSFQGRITLKVLGSDILKSYVHLLTAFGTFSGVGIKTALGMGKMKKTGGEEWKTKS